MDKGTILYQGIVVGEVERKEFEGRYKYLFTYDPSFDEYFQLADLEIREEPYEFDDVPTVITADLAEIASDKLATLRHNNYFRDDFDLWLACCDAGLIESDTGCRVTR